MLITVEGIDGSGKSTVCRAIADAYPDTVITAEPTDSWYGDAVRRSIDGAEADPLAELFLYTADHADHLDRVIEPALAKNRTVISDRYVDSRYAYQGATLADRFEDAMAFVRSIHEPWTREPDLTMYLDVPADVGAARSGETTKFERVDRLEEVRVNYERLIAETPERFHRIDATRSSDTVAAAVLSVVDEALGADRPQD